MFCGTAVHAKHNSTTQGGKMTEGSRRERHALPRSFDFSNARAAWLSRNILPHEPALRAQLLRWRVPHDLDIDDIVQETYAKLATLDDVESIRYPRAYFFQAARSVVLMHARRSRVVDIQAVEQIEQLGVASDEPGPDVQAADRQQLRLLASMIADLPKASRTAMTLRLSHGLSHNEIGDRLGMTANAVQKCLSRSLSSFVRQLGRTGADVMEGSEIRS
jgi:RNA polymerase sigma factor (sigma-70 family)